jgi:hypothetical protein
MLGMISLGRLGRLGAGCEGGAADDGGQEKLVQLRHGELRSFHSLKTAVVQMAGFCVDAWLPAD